MYFSEVLQKMNQVTDITVTVFVIITMEKMSFFKFEFFLYSLNREEYEKFRQDLYMLVTVRA